MVGGKSEREEYLNLYVFDYDCVIMLGSESEECCNFRKKFVPFAEKHSDLGDTLRGNVVWISRRFEARFDL